MYQISVKLLVGEEDSHDYAKNLQYKRIEQCSWELTEGWRSYFDRFLWILI